MPRITVVNDNPDFLELAREVLEDENHEATAIDMDTPDTLERIRASRPDLLIIDLLLGNPGGEGWRLAQQARSLPGLEGLPLLLCSADLQGLSQIEPAVSETARAETLAKPFAIEELTAAIDRLLGERMRG